MPSTFKQPELNLREEVNKLTCLPAKVAENTRALLPLQAYTGKNLLINADKTISQRGDFSTPTATVHNTYYLDRFNVSQSVIAGTIQHKPFESEAESEVVRMEITTGGTGYHLRRYKFEELEYLSGKTVTFAAKVKSNTPINIYLNLNFGASTQVSPTRTEGNEEWELLTWTTTLPEGLTSLNYHLGNWYGSSPTLSVGDYFEVGNEQLELGSEFTGFECVPPQIQLANCQRYYQKLNTLFLTALSARTTIYCTNLLPTIMRSSPSISFGTVTDIDTSGLTITTITADEAQIRSFTLSALGTVGDRYTVGNTELDAEL